MPGDDDDLDFMSDAFLKELETLPAKARPTTYSERRKQQLQRQQAKGHTKSKAETEHEQRTQGLQTAISQESVGFRLMAKMGYKAGTALGASSSGLIEPISVTIKSGTEQEQPHGRKRTQGEVEALEAQHAIAADEYRRALVARFDGRRVESDLAKARKACRDMDERAGIPENAFWPRYAAEVQDVDDEGGDKDGSAETEPTFNDMDVSALAGCDPRDQLRLVNAYLREKYNYCVWCGSVYSSAEEMASQCPGDTAGDHEDM
ncbi:hypothetical protein BC831DRAFT_421734 [Entophlyctis helioformis]|nr:hypothetical protein BC831DRAFT_421734 [Entophlyctis helioformis]